MPRNIVLLADGTGNSHTKGNKTNVWRMYEALDLRDRSLQIAAYSDGVGTSRYLASAVIGQALGLGLRRIVLDLYSFLSSVYRPGDRLYLFGFSRGAYAMLVLSELIETEGMVQTNSRRELERLVDDAYSAFLARLSPHSAWQSRVAGRIVLGLTKARNAMMAKVSYDSSSNRASHIHFLGLWDTVDAYALPIAELRRAWDKYIWRLSIPIQVRLSPSIEKICHALSLDDERATFHPVLVDETAQPAATAHTDEERITQVWFSGVHSDVGGGYLGYDLSLVSLSWMMREAANKHLLLVPDLVRMFESGANPYGQLHDSRQGVARYFRYGPRDVGRLTRYAMHVGSDPKIHESVMMRLQDDREYAPLGVPARYRVVGYEGQLAASTERAPEWREREQERVWDLAWLCRQTYWLALVATLYLFAFPLLHPPLPWGACQGRLCFVSEMVRGVLAPVRAIASPWVDAYASNIDWLLIGIIACVAFWRTADRIMVRMRALMRGVWLDSLSWRHAEGEAGQKRKRSLLGRLRMNRVYLGVSTSARQVLGPAVFVSAVVGSIVILGHRVAFNAAVTNGRVCRHSQTTRPLLSRHEVVLRGSTICMASGLTVHQGRLYRLQVTVTAPFAVSPDGGGAPLLAWPFKRWPSEAWFTPIARIGALGFDEYPLRRIHREQFFEKTLEEELTARTTGELFFYVNDSMPVLGMVDFYTDNDGLAKIMIEPIRVTTE